MRFKIDIYGSSYYLFALFINRSSWFREEWEVVERFETRDKAKEYYEKIKDLPEYLQ